jgi:hypothetical protein
VDDLNRLLAEDDTLAPSSGFTDRVMTAVAEADAEPPPMPFPWARFGVLVLTCAAWTASGAWLATTPALAALGTALGGLDQTTQRIQDLSVAVAILFAAAVVMARWRPERTPSP